MQEARCPSCFAPDGGVPTCGRCGYSEAAGDPQSGFLLPPRLVLLGQYMVGLPLGRPSWSGITYTGWDLNLQARIVIKEFLPRKAAVRASGSLDVIPISSGDAEVLRHGLDRFLREGRTLGQLSHPSIVRVLSAFKANQTAYIVTEHYEGISLRQHLEKGPLSERESIAILVPILSGLAVVHAKGYLHRDIRPANIHLPAGRPPVLTEFGAARHAAAEQAKSLHLSLASGYTALEQYQEKGELGTWTDIYSVCATAYAMVTGTVPMEAPVRALGEVLPPLRNAAPGVSEAFEQAVHRGMALRGVDRPGSVEELLGMLPV